MKNFDVVAETRRGWTADERRQIVAESETAPVSVVARRHGVAVSLGFVKKSGAVFVPVMLIAPSAPEALPETLITQARAQPVAAERASS